MLSNHMLMIGYLGSIICEQEQEKKPMSLFKEEITWKFKNTDYFWKSSIQDPAIPTKLQC